MKPFDNYEISPCRRLNDEGNPDPDGLTFEVCEPHEADVWTLYGHIPGEGVEAIGDFISREAAEQTFERITGMPVGSHEEVAARVRVMHAGPRLLEAMQTLVEEADNISYHTPLWKGFWNEARAGVADATDGKPSQPKPDSLEALFMASSYIRYVKENNPELHTEADGSHSIEQAVEAAFAEAHGRSI